jgi:hypothetical protein
LILFGLVFCFAGNTFINAIIFLTGTIVSFLGLAYVSFTIVGDMNKNPSDGV